MLKKILLIHEGYGETGLFKEALAEVAPHTSFCYARNGHDAFIKLKKGKIRRPDIIFSDIDMPAASEWQFLKEIKGHQRFKDIPVIVYSSSSHNKDINQAIELGAFGFFVKPGNYEQLKNRLQMITDAFATTGAVKKVG